MLQDSVSVTVHWVVVLVHEVASLRRFPDISKDYSGFNFRVKQPKALQPFVCVRGGGGGGVRCIGGTECYNVTCHKTLSGAALLWDLKSHILLHIWVGLGPSQHRHWMSWLHVFVGFFTLQADPRMVPWFRALSLSDSLHCIFHWSCCYLML